MLRSSFFGLSRALMYAPTGLSEVTLAGHSPVVLSKRSVNEDADHAPPALLA
jgi:hypothetical protein